MAWGADNFRADCTLAGRDSSRLYPNAATATAPIATLAAIGSASVSAFPRLARLLISFPRSPCPKEVPGKI